MTELDSAVESLLRDPQYLLRLYHKVLHCLVRCDQTSSARSLSKSFVEIDARYRVRAQVQAMELWVLKGILRQIFPTKAMNDREILILLAMLPLEEYGDGSGGESSGNSNVLVSPVVLLRCLRNICPLRASTICKMLHAIDRLPKRPHSSESVCGIALAGSRHDGKGGVCFFDTAEIIDYLTQSFGFTLSEAFFLVDYCAAGTAVKGNSSVGVDGAYLYTLLYKRPLPADVYFPLLLTAFTEAVGDPKREGSSGTMALIEELRRVPLEPGQNVGSKNASEKNNTCTDIEADLADHYITFNSFEILCKALQVGMPTEDLRRLFFYLGEDKSSDVVCVRTLVREFVRHLAPVGESLFGIVEEVVRRYVVKAGGMLALPRLHVTLPNGFLPIKVFSTALREAGVPAVITDVELEWLRFKGQDKMRLIQTLSGKFPANREALVKQLFEKIKSTDNGANENGGIHVDHVLKLFQPEKAENALIGSGDEWRRMMSCLFRENKREILKQDYFVYFWRAVSAGCSDDSVFTMILWRCFNMHTSR